MYVVALGCGIKERRSSHRARRQHTLDGKRPSASHRQGVVANLATQTLEDLLRALSAEREHQDHSTGTDEQYFDCWQRIGSPCLRGAEQDCSGQHGASEAGDSLVNLAKGHCARAQQPLVENTSVAGVAPPSPRGSFASG